MPVKPLHFLLALLLAFGASFPSMAQIHDPVTWDFALYDNGDGTLDLDFHATVEPGWHVYSQFLNPFDGPIPTSFTIETEGVQTADTAAAECEPILEYDPNFMLDLLFFEKDVHWVHTVLFPGTIPASIKGYLTFMVCDESKCLPPEDVDFDDDDRKASHDVLLTDVDDSEWTVTLELSRSDRSGAWLIDKLWCEEIDLGEGAPRTIASGLREYVPLASGQPSASGRWALQPENSAAAQPRESVVAYC